MGGLSKKAFQLEAIAAKNAAIPHLELDAGNLLFKRNTLTSGQEPQEKATAKAIVKAYDAMGYDAVAVGGQDLAAGISVLQSLRKGSKFTWLSANLVRQSTGKVWLKPYATLKAGAIKVGVIGLTGPALLQAADDVTIRSWYQVLPELVAKVSKDHDLVILLSNLSVADNTKIAEAYHTIHLIIQSGAANIVSAEPINNTVMVNAGPQGKQLGVLEIDWRSGKRWATQQRETLARKKEALAQVRVQLGAFRQEQDPEKALRNRPEQLGIYHMLQDRERDFQREIEQLSRETESLGPATELPSQYRNRFEAMEVTLPDQPEVLAIVSELKKEIALLGKRQSRVSRPIAPAADRPYLGSFGCRSCHPAQYTAWQNTRHAGAYETLVRERQQFTPECLPCHVTGLSPAQGREGLSLPPERRGVGCESCHGPGRRHGERPKVVALPRKPASGVCLACHSRERDPDFEYGKQIIRVGH